MAKEEDVREKIIKAAMKVFAKYGFFKAPIRQIAIEAGVSKGLIFWYFRSKDELILEIANRALPIDVIKNCINRGFKGKELLRCIGKNYLRKYSDPVNKSLFLHTLSAESIYPKIQEQIRTICEKYVRLTARKVYGYEDNKTRIRIRTFFGALLCYTLRPPYDISIDEYIEELTNLIYNQR